MEKIRVGVIGVGYLGKFHAQKYAAMEEAILVGVADIEHEVAAEVASQYEGVTAYRDYREMLDHVDAVSIVVPTTRHHEVAAACLEKGVHVLVEKPMTSSLAEADDLIERADRANCILQVGLLERFNPAVLGMEDFLTHPMFIESHRIHTFKPRGIDVDVVLDLMIHDIDIILSIVKSPIKTIHTVGVPVITPLTDIANTRLIFENGCTANVTVSRVSKDNLRRLRVFQPQAYIAVDYGKKELMVIRLKKDPAGGMPEEELIKRALPEEDALENELRDFVHNVRTGTIPRVSGIAGRQALDVALQIMEQNRRHREMYAKLLKG